ncbi:IS630 transposase (fragment) (plasmid) [Agrobacterium pusense]|uniref:IS630 transposase n=1 Tax=Agrobacterium pusense TaxID=648995 RepID=U4Q415_9HYPH
MQHHLDPERLVFIDETWIKTNMTPIRAGDPEANVCEHLHHTSLAHPDIPRGVAER